MHSRILIQCYDTLWCRRTHSWANAISTGTRWKARSSMAALPKVKYLRFVTDAPQDSGFIGAFGYVLLDIVFV